MLLLKSSSVSPIADTASIVVFILTDVHATLHRLLSVCNAGTVSCLACRAGTATLTLPQPIVPTESRHDAHAFEKGSCFIYSGFH